MPWKADFHHGLLGAADLDGDDDLDVLVALEEAADFTHRRLSWLENQDQGGTFVEHVIHEPSEGIFSILFSPSDLDRDGDLDIVFAGSGPDDVIWFENNGGDSPGFTPHVIDVDFGGHSVEIEDYDGDGDDDFTLGNSVSFDYELRLYENQGGQPLTFASHTLGFFPSRDNQVVVDLNLDGRVDVAMPESNADDGIGLTWLENLGGLTFTSHTLLPYVDVNPRLPHVVDLGANGDPDIVGTDSDNTFRIEAESTVGGWISGVTPGAVECRNRTTGQRVRDEAPRGILVDCLALGLTVSPGDRVEVQVRGTVQ